MAWLYIGKILITGNSLILGAVENLEIAWTTTDPDVLNSSSDFGKCFFCRYGVSVERDVIPILLFSFH